MFTTVFIKYGKPGGKGRSEGEERAPSTVSYISSCNYTIKPRTPNLTQQLSSCGYWVNNKDEHHCSGPNEAKQFIANPLWGTQWPFSICVSFVPMRAMHLCSFTPPQHDPCQIQHLRDYIPLEGLWEASTAKLKWVSTKQTNKKRPIPGTGWQKE